MFTKNAGSVDRIVRVLVGAALLVAFFATTGGPWHWLLLIGIVPLITGLLGSCPAYRLLGLSTCPMKRP